MKPKANYMDPDQFTILLAAIPRLNLRKYDDEDVRMLFKIAYWCGLRITEACRLKAEDFDLAGRELFLGKTKTKKLDYAPIPAVFIPELEDYLRNKTGLINGSNRNTVDYWLRKLGKMLNITALTTPQKESGEKTKCHIFRKSIGKDMIYGSKGMRKAPLNVVMKQLRHTNIATTSKYLQVGLEDVKDFWEPKRTEQTDDV